MWFDHISCQVSHWPWLVWLQKAERWPYTSFKGYKIHQFSAKKQKGKQSGLFSVFSFTRFKWVELLIRKKEMPATLICHSHNHLLPIPGGGWQQHKGSHHSMKGFSSVNWVGTFRLSIPVLPLIYAWILLFFFIWNCLFTQGKERAHNYSLAASVFEAVAHKLLWRNAKAW